jgi:hypothetical protein
MLHTLCFSFQIAVYFIMLAFLVPVLFTISVQGALKLKCKIRVLKVKTDLQEFEKRGYRVNRAGLRWGQVAGICECSNEHSGYIKCGVFLWLAFNLLASQEGLCSMV